MLASRASSASFPTEASVDAAVHGACARGLLGPAKSVDDYPLGFFYDLDAFEAKRGEKDAEAAAAAEKVRRAKRLLFP